MATKSRFEFCLAKTFKASFGVCIFLSILLAVDATAAQNNTQNSSALPASHDSVKKLVQQLGSEDYQLRLAAEKQLFDLGAPSIGPLKQARKDGDCEIRLRSRRLLARVLRKDHELRTEQFLASTGTEEFGLTGWQEFSSIAGTESAARRLFVSMHDTEKEFFQAWRTNADNLQQAGDSVLNKVPKISGANILPTLAVALFAKTREQDGSKTAASEDDVLLEIENHQSNIANLLDGEGARVAQVIKASGEWTAFRRLIVRWLKSLPGSTLGKTIKMRIAKRFDLLEFVDEIATSLGDAEVAVEVRAEAIAFVAGTRRPEFIERMQSLLHDQTVLGSFDSGLSKNHKLEVRISDIALAGVVFIAEKPFSEFGFEHYRGLPDEFITLSQAGFASEEKRQLSRNKWNDCKKETIEKATKTPEQSKTQNGSEIFSKN